MVDKNLYNKIIESIAYTVKKSLLERDLDDDGQWEFDEEIGGNENKPTTWWEGVYDLTTDQIFWLGDDFDTGIDPTTDEWNGLHQYVSFNATPDDYEEYHRSGTYFDPEEWDVTIKSYEIDIPYPFMFTTNEHEGKYYYEGDEDTKTPFNGFTEQQIKNITNYLNDNVSVNYWDWD